MVLRGLMLLLLVLLCAAAHGQEPRLILRAAFDGDCALGPAGQGQLVAGEFVEGREGQAIKAAEPGKPAATIPLADVNTEEGTLMFWFQTDVGTPERGGQTVRHRPIGTREGPGPEMTVAQAHHQTNIALDNTWNARGGGGPSAVFGHLLPGKWYHLAYTWKKDGYDVCFWLFGEAQGDTLGKWSRGEVSDEPWDATLEVGSEHMAIDDLRIYEGAMTAEQITAAGDYGEGECMYDEGRIFFDTTLDAEAIKGELLVEDTFDQPWEKGWVLEGPGILTQENGRLRIQEPNPGQEGANHIVLWNKQTFPKDFIAEWEFTPNEVAGLCIVFFCAAGRNGEDIFDPSLAKRDGTFTGYHSGDINCYHISYFRNTCARSPNCALRKNLGFYRASAGYDYIPLEAGVTSKLTLAKRGAHIQFAINGRISIDWVDDGITRRPVWGGGKIGLRQMMTTDGWYDNFRVWAARQ